MPTEKKFQNCRLCLNTVQATDTGPQFTGQVLSKCPHSNILLTSRFHISTDPRKVSVIANNNCANFKGPFPLELGGTIS